MQAVWLLKLCGQHPQQAVDALPATQACQLVLSEASHAGVSPSGLDGSSLQQGYGHSVCLLLDQLADRALQATGFQWDTQPPKVTTYASACSLPPGSSCTDVARHLSVLYTE